MKLVNMGLKKFASNIICKYHIFLTLCSFKSYFSIKISLRSGNFFWVLEYTINIVSFQLILRWLQLNHPMSRVVTSDSLYQQETTLVEKFLNRFARCMVLLLRVKVKWVQEFQDGQDNNHDEECSSCPSLITNTLVGSVEEKICKNRGFTITGLSKIFKGVKVSAI